MKYKAYITDSDKIFWTKNSIDKPTKDYFLELMGSIEWKDLGNITPNFINQFNGSITVDKDNYTYLKLINTETNEIKYYSIDSISRILNNGFVVDITLDVFTTYTLYFYESIKEKPIKVNRTTAFGVFKNNPNAQLLQDELIHIPFSPSVYNYSLSNPIYDIFFSQVEPDATRWYRYTMFNNETWTFLERKTSSCKIDRIGTKQTGYPPGVNVAYFYTMTLFDVYQDINGDWYLVPEFGYESLDYTYQNDCIFATFIADVTYFCSNHKKMIKKFRDNTYWVNKYKGKFYIPKWVNLVQCAIPILVETQQFSTSNYLLMFKIIDSFFLDYKLVSTITFNFNFSNFCLKEFNVFSDKPNAYAFSKTTQNDNTYNVFDLFSKPDYFATYLFIEKDNLNLKFWINQSNGINWVNRVHNVNIMVSGNETFPTSTSDYQSYLASVQSQQNTQIQVAKQQSIFGGIKAAIGGVLGVAGSLATGNIAGAVSSGVNAISGIAGSVMQYQNKKREIDAQNADKQRSSTANQINPSSISSVISNGSINSIGAVRNQRIALNQIDGIIANNPFNKEMNFTYNRTVWESGYKVNQYYRLNDPHNYQISFFDDYKNKFIYWDVEVPTEFVKQTYPNYNNELVSAIEITINNPVRFWKQNPDYTCNLIMEQTDR